MRDLPEYIPDKHANHRAIANGLLWGVVFVLMGTIARAGKEVAIAYRYGISAEVDAYLFIYNLVTWPVGVWFSILTIVLVPLVARAKQTSPCELPNFRSELLGLTVIIGLALTAAIWAGVLLSLKLSWTGLTATTLNTAIGMVPALAWLALMGSIISLYSAWVMAAGRHANTLLESVPALVILVALFAFPESGIQPLIWGTLAGFALHLLSLGMVLAKQGQIEKPRFSRESIQWNPFWQGFSIMIGGQVLMSLILVVDQFFAAHMETGAISSLSYASRLIALILSLGATTISRATLPVFSKAQAQGERNVNRIALQWVTILFLIGLFTIVAGWVLAPTAISLLFEHGAFTSYDTKVVTEIFRYGLAQMPFYFSGLVMVSLLVSKRKYHAILIIGALNLLVKLLFNVLLVNYLGVGGLMAATSVMMLFSWLFLATTTLIIDTEE